MKTSVPDNRHSTSQVQKAFTSFKGLFSIKGNNEHSADCKKPNLFDDYCNTSEQQGVSGVINSQLFLTEFSKDPIPQCDISDEIKSISSTSEYLPSIYPPTFNMVKSSDQIDEPEMNKQNIKSSVFSSLKAFFSKKRNSAQPTDRMPSHNFVCNQAASPAYSDTPNILTTRSFLAQSRESLVSIDLEDDQDINNNSIINEEELCPCIPIQTSIKQSIVQGIQRIFGIKSKYKRKEGKNGTLSCFLQIRSYPTR